MITPQSIDSTLLLNCPSKGQWGNIVGAMKPGAHLLMLNNVRSHHLGTISAEDAGLEIRDTLAYVFADSENGDVAMQLIAMARKPLEGTVAENTLRYGTGGLNIESCRIKTEESLNGGAYTNGRDPRAMQPGGGLRYAQTGEFSQPEGRWPANLILQGCPSVKEMFPDAKSGSGNGNAIPGVPGNITPLRRGNLIPRRDTGSAARFFYSAPTLNTLIEYLLKLITPSGGTVLTSPNFPVTTDEFHLIEHNG